MSRRSSSGSGCLLIFGVLVIIVCGLVLIGPVLQVSLWVIGKFFSYVGSGLKVCFPFLMIFGLPLLGIPIVFYFTHRKPLSYEQVEKLSRRRAKNYATKNYTFSKTPMTANLEFKSRLDTTGRWYSINEPLNTFPSLVADLLKGKHHEWVVIALEKNGIVYKMWTNKGLDNQSVSFNCDLNDIIHQCILNKGYSVLRFHNHPNPNPNQYTTLLASETDLISARSCSEIVCKSGFNWFDFVCAQGNYLLFYSRMSDSFQIKGSTVSDLVDICGITPSMDFNLQKEYYHLNNNYTNAKRDSIITLSILTIFLFLFFFIGINTSKKQISKNSVAVATTTTIEVSEPESNQPPYATTTVITTTTEPVPINEIWATSPTSLENFKYYRRDETIYLEKYIGNDTKIWIADEYTVEGKTCKVANTIENLFANSDVYSVILPEGITHVSDSIFAYSSVKYIYIPASLEPDNNSNWYERLRSVIKVYYGDNEDRWKELTNHAERSSINAIQIICDVTIDDLYEKYGHQTTYRSLYPGHRIKPTDINCFEFYIEGDTIFLTKYIGESDFVWIDTEYIIDNKTYIVGDTLDSLKGLSNATTIIISEGFTVLDENEFSSCNKLQRIFLPKSLDSEKCGAFYLNLHKDVASISYGGSKDDWNILTNNADRLSINATDIIYDVDYEEVKQKFLAIK